MSELKGRVAVITGAASGIGRALAHEAASHGMRLLLADRDAGGLKQVEKELAQAGLQLRSQVTDVTVEADLQRLAATAEHEFGEVNLLFNNAGVCPIGMAWDMSADDWQWVLNVNVMGVVHGQKAFLPMMMAQRGPARVINMGSIAGLFSSPGGSAYQVSKHAVVALTESLSLDLQMAQSPVKASVVCPGFVATNLAAGTGSPTGDNAPESVKRGREALQRTIAQGTSPDDLAALIFAGIEADQFWIFTHPEALAGFEMRCESIRNRTEPYFAPMLD